MIALSLAILCFLGVLAFHFPEYLTPPLLRKSYDVETLRKVLFAAMVIAGGLSLVNILFNRSRWLSSFAFLLVALSAVLGGHKVEVGPNFPDHRKRSTRTTPRTSPSWTTCSARPSTAASSGPRPTACWAITCPMGS